MKLIYRWIEIFEGEILDETIMNCYCLKKLESFLNEEMRIYSNNKSKIINKATDLLPITEKLNKTAWLWLFLSKQYIEWLIGRSNKNQPVTVQSRSETHNHLQLII